MKKIFSLILILLIIPIIVQAGFSDWWSSLFNTQVEEQVGASTKVFPRQGGTGQDFSASTGFIKVESGVFQAVATSTISTATTTNFSITDLTNCDTIDTDAYGNLTCGVDNTAAGAFATTSADFWFDNTTGITGNTNIVTVGTLTNAGGNISLWTNDLGYLEESTASSTYLQLTSYFSTTTHELIDTLPSLSITESQVSDLGDYITGAYATSTYQPIGDYITDVYATSTLLTLTGGTLTDILSGTEIDLTYGLSAPTSTITALTATSLIIGANTLDTNEWAILDNVDGNVSFWTNDADYFTWANATSTYFPLTGGTITGSSTFSAALNVGGYLTLSGDPTELLHAATREYVDMAVTSLGAAYYMYDEEDVTGYKTCYLDPSSDSEAYIDGASLSDNDYIGGWISAPGEAPQKLLKGVYDWYITAEKTAGTQSLRVYWTLIERKSDTSETVIATSSNSNEIDGKSAYIVSLSLSEDHILDSGSRIIGKLYADVSGGGSTPTARIYYQGTNSSRWEIPANTEIYKNIFVPYSGAVKDLDLGAKTLTVGELVSASSTYLTYGIEAATGTFSGMIMADGGITGDLTGNADTATDLREGATTTLDWWATQNNVSLFINDAGYLEESTASTTYLSIENASLNYLTQANATTALSVYLEEATASTTYARLDEATSTMDGWELEQTSRAADDLSDDDLDALQNVAALTESQGDTLYYDGSNWNTTSTIYIDKSTGYVGISTTTPKRKFHAGEAQFGINTLSAGNSGMVNVELHGNDPYTQALKLLADRDGQAVLYGFNGTAIGANTKNVGLYGWASGATTNLGILIDSGDAQFDEDLTIGGNATSSGFFAFPSYTSCTALETDSSGRLVCGEDDTAAGAFATSSADYWLTSKDTGDLTEGTNLYWTTARGDTQTDAHLSGGTAITYNAGAISVTADEITDTELAFNTGQHLTTTANPTFGGLTLTTGLTAATSTIGTNLSIDSSGNLTTSGTITSTGGFIGNADTASDLLEGATTTMDWWETQQTARHAAVTLTGQDYLTLSTQEITAGEIEPDDLAGSDFGDFTCDGDTCLLDLNYLTYENASTTYFIESEATTTLNWWLTTQDTDALTEGSSNLYNQTHTGDVTGSVALTIGTEKVVESMIDFTLAPTLNYVVYYDGSKLSYVATTTWNTDTQDLSYDAGTDVISLTDGGSIDITEVDTTCDGNSCNVTNTGTLDGYEASELTFSTTTNNYWAGQSNISLFVNDSGYITTSDWTTTSAQYLLSQSAGTNLTWDGSEFDVTDSWWNADEDISEDTISESKIIFGTACAAGNHYYLNGNDLACEADDDTTYTADNPLTLVGTVFGIESASTTLWETDNNTTYSASGTLLDLTSEVFSIKEGTLTSGKLCTFDGTNLVCNSDDDDVPDAGDFGAATDLDSNGAVIWGNITAGELADNSIIDADIDDDGNFTFTGNWDFSGGDIELNNDSVDDADINWAELTDLNAGGEVAWSNLTSGELTSEVLILGTDVKAGTLTDTKLCTWDSGNTQIVCDSTDQTGGAFSTTTADYWGSQRAGTGISWASDFDIDDPLTLTDLLTTNSTTTGSLVIPHGATCNSDEDGELCHDTTDDQLILDGKVIRTDEKIWSVTIASTSIAFVSGGELPVPPEKDGYTITSYSCYVTGGTSVVITPSGASQGDLDAITCGTTITKDTDMTAGSEIAADELVKMKIGTITGDVNYASFTAFGTYTCE